MLVPGSANPLLLRSAAAAGGYSISRSLRFNSSDSAYCGRTVSSANTSNTTSTLSWWCKRTKLGATSCLFSGYDGSSTYATYIQFNAGDTFTVTNPGYNVALTTSQVFRDPSAWYHFVLVWDTTNATSGNRYRLFVNGVRVTAFSTAVYPSQNDTGRFIYANSNNRIGTTWGSSGYSYCDAYLADVHLVDGQALDPTSFGEFDATTGVWVPKAYTGTYGTNGFKLDFADNSSNTATTLGKDTSGNGNNWTPNNLSVGSSNTTIWSNYVTASTGSFYPGNVASNLFDVNLSNVVDANSTSGTVTFTPPSTIAYSSKVEILQGGQSASYTLTRGDNTTATITSTSNSWSTLTTGSGSIKSISSTGTGNYNNWRAIRVDDVILYDPSAAGIANDSLVDVPTNGTASSGADPGGSTRGNYCTLNPLDNGGITLTNGNLDWSRTSAGTRVCYSTIGVSSGKWYFESSIVGATSGVNWECGVATVGTSNAIRPGTTATGWQVQTSGSTTIVKQNNNTTTTIFTGTISSGDIFSVALDMDNGRIWFGRNGTWLEGSPSAGTGASFTNLSGTVEAFAGGDGAVSGSINFGQRPFAYTAPSGFKALCTANLPAPAVVKSNTVFDTVLWTGNDTGQTITMPGAFSPDFVWTKMRSSANAHWLFDVIRGTNQGLSSSSTTNELTRSSSVTAFGSTGFTLGTSADVNSSAYTYVGWVWDAGSSTTTIAANAYSAGVPSITSQVRANASAGFSIVTYTGTGANATVGHGLGVAPGMTVVKDRTSGVFNWAVWHSALGGGDYALQLNNTSAKSNAFDYWNGDPTSTVFTLGTDNGTNKSGDNYVAYCFAPVVGYSSFGSYTGNGSSDGPFVYTGFRPRWVMIKSSSAAGDWAISDGLRPGYNVTNNALFANLSDAEYTVGNYQIDALSNGFKIRGTTSGHNTSSVTYIYAAFAESPFNYARAR